MEEVSPSHLTSHKLFITSNKGIINILGIFLKLHTYNYTFIACIRWERGCDKPNMKELYMENIVTTPKYLGFLSRYFPEYPLPTLYDCCL